MFNSGPERVSTGTPRARHDSTNKSPYHDADIYETMHVKQDGLGIHGDHIAACSNEALSFFASPQWGAHGSVEGTYADDQVVAQVHDFEDPDEFCDYNIKLPTEPSMYSEPLRYTQSDPAAPRNNNNAMSATEKTNHDWTVPLLNSLRSILRQLAALRIQAYDLSLTPGAFTLAGIPPNLDFLDTTVDASIPGASLGSALLGKAIIATVRFALVLQTMAPSPVDWTGLVGDVDSERVDETAFHGVSSRSSPELVPSPHQQLRPPKLSGASETVRAAPQVMLMVLSTYLQVGELFDIILSPTVRSLCNPAGESSGPGDHASNLYPSPLSSSLLQTSPGNNAAPTPRPRSPILAQSRSQDILMTIRVIDH